MATAAYVLKFWVGTPVDFLEKSSDFATRFLSFLVCLVLKNSNASTANIQRSESNAVRLQWFLLSTSHGVAAHVVVLLQPFWGSVLRWAQFTYSYSVLALLGSPQGSLWFGGVWVWLLDRSMLIWEGPLQLVSKQSRASCGETLLHELVLFTFSTLETNYKSTNGTRAD